MRHRAVKAERTHREAASDALDFARVPCQQFKPNTLRDFNQSGVISNEMSVDPVVGDNYDSMTAWSKYPPHLRNSRLEVGKKTGELGKLTIVLNRLGYESTKDKAVSQPVFCRLRCVADSDVLFPTRNIFRCASIHPADGKSMSTRIINGIEVRWRGND
jgi:hypothetical protein